MQTTRQIERLWGARQYDRLALELLRPRVEFSHRLASEFTHSAAVAALAVIRMDELNQGFHPLNQVLIRTIIAAQEGDGGWGDLVVSAVCLRALMCNRGQGAVIERGLNYIANLQKDEGAWPAVPIRRTDSDAFVSAFILFQLAEHEAFRAAVRLDAAVAWFGRNEAYLDDDTRKLWHRASMRARLRTFAAELAPAQN